MFEQKKEQGTQGTVLCVLTKHPNKHHGARSQSLPAPRFAITLIFSPFFLETDHNDNSLCVKPTKKLHP